MFNIRKEIIRAFKSSIFPYADGFKVDEESDEELYKESDEKLDEKLDEELDEKLDKNKFFKDIENESCVLNKSLIMICLKHILVL